MINNMNSCLSSAAASSYLHYITFAIKCRLGLCCFVFFRSRDILLVFKFYVNQWTYALCTHQNFDTNSCCFKFNYFETKQTHAINLDTSKGKEVIVKILSNKIHLDVQYCLTNTLCPVYGEVGWINYYKCIFKYEETDITTKQSIFVHTPSASHRARDCNIKHTSQPMHSKTNFTKNKQTFTHFPNIV